MNILKNFFSSIFSGIILFSCASMGEIHVQLAYPPEDQISPKVQRIAILNRSMKLNFTDSSNYSPNFKKGLSFGKMVFDSLAADTAIKIAARAIFSSQRFDVTIPYRMNFFRNDTNELLPPLDTSFVNSMCKEYNVDALLVLENFAEKTEGKYRNTGEGSINVSYSTDWGFYNPSDPNKFKLFCLNDIISWRFYPYWEFRLASDKLPTIKEALIEGGIASGVAVTDQICPVWTDAVRYFCKTRNKAIDKAIPLIKENKWPEAEEVWKKYSSEPDLSLRSKIEYNIALAEEMTDDLNEALEWIIKSLKTKYSEEAKIYYNELITRITRFKKIQKGYSS